MIRGRDTPHPEAAIDPPLLFLVDDVEFRFDLARVEDWQFVVQEFGRGRPAVTDLEKVGIQAEVVVDYSNLFQHFYWVRSRRSLRLRDKH